MTCSSLSFAAHYRDDILSFVIDLENVNFLCFKIQVSVNNLSFTDNLVDLCTGSVEICTKLNMVRLVRITIKICQRTVQFTVHDHPVSPIRVHRSFNHQNLVSAKYKCLSVMDPEKVASEDMGSLIVYNASDKACGSLLPSKMIPG